MNFSMIGCCILFCFFSISFLFDQSVWTDETTQLSGLTLSLDDLIQWLLGKEYDLDVPFDRTPPLSYLIGKLWAGLFGLNILSMRIMSLCFATGALCLFIHATCQAFGKQSALLAGLLFATSPNLIIIGVEIRSYAILLAFSALAILFYLRICFSRGHLSWNYFWLAVASLCTIYTHYFGLLFAFCLLLSLFIIQWSRRQPLMPCVITICGVALGSLGLIPFIMSALHFSAVGHEKANFTKLIYRFLFHASITERYFLLISIIGAIGLAIMAFLRKKVEESIVLLLPLAIGLGTLYSAQFVLRGFDVASTQYNIWMLPLLFIFLSTGIHQKNVLSYCLAVCLLLGPLSGDYQLLINGQNFSHGRYQAVEKLIRKYEPDIAVVYDQGEYGSIMPSFAFRYLFHGALPQYQVQEYFPKIELKMLPRTAGEKSEIDKLDKKFILVIESQNESAIAIQNQIREKVVNPLPPGQLVKLLINSSKWKLIDRQTYLAFLKMEVYLFEKE